MDENRQDTLDGLRAVAVLLVALYHYAVFWAPSGRGEQLLPYGDALFTLPFAAQGGLGVNLFFILSGLVITFSLTRAPTALVFLTRRVIRLWPSLLLCGSLTFLAINTLGPPVLERSLAEAFISMTFVPPAHVGRAIGQPGMEWLDGAYWSLWVEVRFYLLAAALFFLMRRRFLQSWALFAAVSAVIHIAALLGQPGADALSRLLFAEFHPYFTAGIALAVLHRERRHRGAIALLTASIGLGLLYAMAEAKPISHVTLILALFGLAIVASLAPRFVPALAGRRITLVGRASYIFYLLHQSLGLSLLTALPLSGWSAVLAMLVIQTSILLLSIALHLKVERPVQAKLRGIRTAKPASA